MKNRSGFIQAYNCKSACTEDQIIISTDVHDLHQLEPMLEHITDATQELDIKENVKEFATYDASFHEGLVIKDTEQKSPDLFIYTKKSHTLHKDLNGKRLSDSRIP